jgi:hypothetical protein
MDTKALLAFPSLVLLYLVLVGTVETRTGETVVVYEVDATVWFERELWPQEV